MTEALADQIRDWDLSGAQTTTGELYNQLHERIDFLRRLHYDQYIPTLGPDHITDFESRLEVWIENLISPADRQVLLEIVPDIIFFGRDEFTKLYQAALRGPVTRWIIDELNIGFSDSSFDDILDREIHQHTWFCSVSDSMQISDFCHSNHLGGINYRPDLRTLGKFGDLKKILDFMQDHRDAKNGLCPLKRMVILEDFIGSGLQLTDAEVLIKELLAANISVLLLPLIICPEGLDTVQRLFGTEALFRCDPIIQLGKDLFINSTLIAGANFLYDKTKLLVQNSYGRVIGNNASHPRPYSLYGFSNTGALVVLYSNTPANTLPIIQHSSNTWNAIFPRSARVK